MRIPDTTEPTGTRAQVPIRYLLALVVLDWVFQVALIWSQHYPPLVDLPNHLAQHSLEYRWWSGAGLPAYYRLDYRLVPYMGSDLTITPMLAVLSPLVAAKVFLSFSVVFYSLGPILYIWTNAGRRAGAVCAGALVLPLALYSAFFWGFIKYYSGVGLAFLVLTHQVWLIAGRRRGWGQGTLHAALVALLFIWHLGAWVIYCVVATCRVAIEVLDSRPDSGRFKARLAIALPWIAMLLPSLALLLVYKIESRGDFAVGFQKYVWGGIIRKLGVPFLVFRTYNKWVDVPVAVLWIATVVVWFRPARLVSPGVRTNLLALCGFLALYLVTPNYLGATSSADSRVIPAIYVCCLAILAEFRVRRVVLGITLLAVCLLIRDIDLAYQWHRLGRELDMYAGAFKHLTPRSRVLTLDFGSFSKERPVRNFVAWAVTDKEIFYPDLFDYPGQVPLRFVNPCILRSTEPQPGGFRYGEDPSCFDFLWVYHGDDRAFRPPTGFELIDRRGPLTVWRKTDSASRPVSIADPVQEEVESGTR